jgi:hypothetical protein
MANLRR